MPNDNQQHEAASHSSPPSGSATWWDAVGTENAIKACLQQIESLRGRLPIGVAQAMLRAHTALRHSLECVESLKPKSPNAEVSDGCRKRAHDDTKNL